MEFGLCKSVPMYEAFLQSPEKFDFLVEPQKYVDVVEQLTVKG